MTRTTTPHDETFSVIDGHLVHTVVPARGKPYEHRCSQASFETLAHAIDERGEAGCTIGELAEAEDLPNTQVAVALAFMRERSCLVTRYRRNYPACRCFFEDAMIEYHALREKGTEV